jgi:hypothetical protein
MAKARIPGPHGYYPTTIDSGTLNRGTTPTPSTTGLENQADSALLIQTKRELAFDISQLILDITGILDPTPVSDGANTLLSLARGNWFDAVVSAVSMVPFVGDLAKMAKLPKYVDSVRGAVIVAKTDPRWAAHLRELFRKLKVAIDKCWVAGADTLPDTSRRQLKALKDEVDSFLNPRNGSVIAKNEVTAPFPLSEKGARGSHKQAGIVSKPESPTTVGDTTIHTKEASTHATNAKIRNKHLAGKEHPKTKVPFDDDGFPVFESQHDVTIPKELNHPDIPDSKQFKHATQDLNKTLEDYPILKSNYTDEQLKAIQQGSEKVPDYTWHHHQDGSTLQLVDELTHGKTGHTGGRALTGGRPR